MNLTIRQLSPADAAAYRALRLATPGATFFGAFDGDALVGSICLRTHARRAPSGKSRSQHRQLLLDSQTS
jgi:hypothetical protein